MLSDLQSRIMVADEERLARTSMAFRARRRPRARERSMRRRTISFAYLATRWQEKMSTWRLSRKLRHRFLLPTRVSPPRL